LQSREQFDDLLSRYNISEDDLRIYREYDSGNKAPPRHIKEFLPDPVYLIEIRVIEESIGKIYYDYFLPGFSIVEEASPGIPLSRFYALRSSGGN
jgi:hypothetical protein